MQTILSWDHKISGWIAGDRSPQMTDFFHWFTKLGEWQIVAGAILFFTAALWFFKKKNFIAPLWISVAATEICVYLLKTIVNRARPAIALFSENGAAFPSNHAALSVAFYGFIFAFLFSISAGRATKTFTIIAGIIVAALLGFSRVYLGVHYPSDVLTGYFIGAFWLFLCLRFIKK